MFSAQNGPIDPAVMERMFQSAQTDFGFMVAFNKTDGVPGYGFLVVDATNPARGILLQSDREGTKVTLQAADTTFSALAYLLVNRYAAFTGLSADGLLGQLGTDLEWTFVGTHRGILASTPNTPAWEDLWIIIGLALDLGELHTLCDQCPDPDLFNIMIARLRNQVARGLQS